jgi:uncharacterized glyoxalase superfamily protein PhnB
MAEQVMTGGGRIIPALRFRNAAAASDWLCTAFGFERKMAVPDEGAKVAHTEFVLGNGMIMLGDVETEYGCLVAAPREGQPVTQGIYVVVDDVDTNYARAKAAGARGRHQDARRWRARLHRPGPRKGMSGPSAITIVGPDLRLTAIARKQRRRPA